MSLTFHSTPIGLFRPIMYMAHCRKCVYVSSDTNFSSITMSPSTTSANPFAWKAGSPYGRPNVSAVATWAAASRPTRVASRFAISAQCSGLMNGRPTCCRYRSCPVSRDVRYRTFCSTLHFSKPFTYLNSTSLPIAPCISNQFLMAASMS